MTTHNDTPERALLTVNDLAAKLVIGRRMVYLMVERGEIPAVLVGERLRFRPEDVDEYLESRRVRGPLKAHHLNRT